VIRPNRCLDPNHDGVKILTFAISLAQTLTCNSSLPHHLLSKPFHLFQLRGALQQQ
jgi:hypothetical protein